MSDVIDIAAAQAERDPAAALDAHSWLGDAISTDAHSDRFAQWGHSTVVDEYVGAAVVSRGLFDALHERAGIAAAWPVGNAGLLHVYGYLLSTVPTPYGLKRERWLGPELARACGLGDDAFVPWASGRTLLSRVTDATRRVLSEAASETELISDVEATIAVSAETGPGAVAYALRSAGASDPPRLVTLFPVSDAAAIRREIAQEPARLRWNAVG